MDKIALLATGDELVKGDIVNSNCQIIAQKLTEAGIEVGNHLTVSDQETAIINCLNYLLEHHDYIIITGGLGLVHVCVCVLCMYVSVSWVHV